MNQLQEALTGVLVTPDVRGAAVVTADGLVAASALGPELDPDALAGVASFLVVTTDRSLVEGGYGSSDRLTVRAAAGQAVLSKIGDSYLVVIYDQDADVTQIDEEAAAAVEQVRLSARMA